MKIQMDIVTHDRSLAYELIGNNSLTEGSIIEVPGGASLAYQSSLLAKAVGMPEVLTFIIDASVAINVNLLAAYLYDKMKNKSVEQITIRRTVVTEISETSIRQVLGEEFNRERR